MNNRESQANQQTGEKVLFSGNNWSLIGGVAAVVFALSGNLLVGQIYSGFEARRFIEAMLPTTQTLTFASITASSTILALMLTLISFTRKLENEFDMFFYRRIKRIGLLSCVALITSILLLLFLSVPLQESDKVPLNWYRIIYYVIISLSALISGLVVTIVLMLFNAISGLIDVVCPDADNAEKANLMQEKVQE